ncbi:3-oxoacyl-[acyl-carrier-protein] reductase FabG [Thalassovita autumnalis]|uniref:3-oxoacyl-[acyl-carrier-protein] reductase FabG n=1 Tax=Thalassovita autumnalis TaxID=2072972 RepID=A0A0P1G764_9RHOB|nr:SDR family oxidoreductase [Thalassovita autumnalis]CUH69911.1 3-oxoacyl-[acyl-carrier-protein] reductase FabG [Thalassovita autumnalis]CUH73298.1 3-oxoacyl-[acyl-carrier-protein] reductase FabG [Thalassovita autumnalis]
MAEFKNKTVLITGASRGIGEAASRLYAEAGANVVMMARSGDRIAAIAEEIGAMALTGDVASYADMQGAIAQTVARFGSLDILINNAGVIEPIGPLADVTPEGWGAVIDINAKGVFNGMHAALPVMAQAGGGTIITISSGAAHNALEGWSAYCTSKAGAAMLTRCADLEYRGKGIRIMGLSPGTVATQMQKDIKASGINAVSQLNWEDHIPADWPARCLMWMCGPAGDDLLGQEVSLRDEDVRKAVGLV